MKNRRRRTLIEPRIQRWFGFLFLGIAMLSAILQTIIFRFALSDLASELPNDGLAAMEKIDDKVLMSFVITLLLLAPLTLSLGTWSTFKIVGPLYRFRVFLREVIRGEKPGPCRIRKTDELHDFCELLNEATAPLRAGGPESAESSQDETKRPAA